MSAENVGTDKNKFLCELCAASFNSRHDLSDHKRTHKLPFKCEICGYLSSTQLGLERHKKSHELRESHLCKVCMKSFSDARHLEIHNLSVHMGLKPFKCDICSMDFKQEHQLRDHMMSKHTGEKPYICNICAASFVRKSHLNRHSVIHLRDTKYKREAGSVTHKQPREYKEVIVPPTYNSKVLNKLQNSTIGIPTVLDKHTETQWEKVYTNNIEIKSGSVAKLNDPQIEEPYKTQKVVYSEPSERPTCSQQHSNISSESFHQPIITQIAFASESFQQPNNTQIDKPYTTEMVINSESAEQPAYSQPHSKISSESFQQPTGTQIEKPHTIHQPTITKIDNSYTTEMVIYSESSEQPTYSEQHSEISSEDIFQQQPINTQLDEPYTTEEMVIYSETSEQPTYSQQHSEISSESFQNLTNAQIEEPYKTEMVIYSESSAESASQPHSEISSEFLQRLIGNQIEEPYQIIIYTDSSEDPTHSQDHSVIITESPFETENELISHCKTHESTETSQCMIQSDILPQQEEEGVVEIYTTDLESTKKSELELEIKPEPDISLESMRELETKSEPYKAVKPKKYRRVKTGEKPYTCKTCSASFQRHCEMVIHARIHSSEKSSICKVCCRAFPDPITLEEHNKKHLGLKPYKCEICSTLFATLLALEAHTQRIHTN